MSQPSTIDAAIERIADELLASGLHRGGVVMVHSSIRALGPVPGGAESVVDGLLHALGETGTLLMPALSYETVPPEHPSFDVRSTPSNVGWLPEYFRLRPGTMRSLHPTHSVCGIGLRAVELLAGHERDTTPCGPNSPFRRLRDAGGQIVMLGCGLRPNTSMHAVEELVEPPYLYGPWWTYHLRDADGNDHAQRYRRHGFNGYRQRYDRIGSLLDQNGLMTGHCLNAEIQIMESSVMWKTALAALNANPYFFVEVNAEMPGR